MRKGILVLLILFVFNSLGVSAQTTKKKPKPRKKTTAELVFGRHPELKGVLGESLRRQNELADAGWLPRIPAQCDLVGYVVTGYLVRVPDLAQNFYLDGGLTQPRLIKDSCNPKKKIREDRRYLAAEPLEYLRDNISARYAVRFTSGKKPQRFKITSLVRTIEYQKRLAWRNPNADQANCATPERCSVHVTGYAFDISTKSMNQEQILWFADALAEDVAQSIVFATFEPNQQNFHIMVVP
ncbi:MAG: hypothetical protein A2945_01005 [Candidatus Liptonbacteria bacterium RIFCSPLOWO2_01_FULL_52_25]|uniref:Peptidase M15A C-terminal domain-containing protein n=1 Tax=Candidatus Liptonbacteria bacterium RIFCSPLOWO2_01_FULL_52_25 TaxID=1798650 RepID=A0A1G2CDE7_9BACT|nr:MAG: hypothetical protein A2945_01005 [Candidatus Liptonbacteria bacterium RIFCSPLOWO2_01_FULL_52_25]